nr:isochorismatase family protein [Actinomycetota bacterium]
MPPRGVKKGMREALLIVDVQNDFVPGGALPVPRGDEILGRVRELIESGRFDLVVATRDWHPPDHQSFEQQGGPWPPHCVQLTPGAELHPDLPRDRIDFVVDAGYRPELECYSGFEQT